MPTKAFLDFALALGIGLLVGLQRQRAAAEIAGIRTFALAALLGAVCGQLATSFGVWIIIAGLLALTSLVVTANVIARHRADYDPGLTTEVALLVIFLLGTLATAGQHALVVVLGGTTALLLHLRRRLHSFARGLRDADMRAIMQFVVVALVILPVLPDRNFGPGGVLNPRQIWWMVVLITGIGLASYVAFQLLGSRGGTVAGGLLGGLISSTATTVSYARRSRSDANSAPATLAALVIMLASTVVFGRVLVLVATISPGQFRAIAPPLVGMLIFTALIAVEFWRRSRRETVHLSPAANPTELRVALGFAALFALVLLTATYAREYFGARGLYIVAVLSGLTDMDAITLSTATLVNRGDLRGEIAGRVILVASLSNIAFKTGVVLVLGSPELRRRIGLAFGITFAVGLGLLAVF